NSITATSFTASTLYVKAKSTFFIAADFSFVRRGVEITNIIKYTCIGCWIGARCSADWRLVNVDYFFQMLETFNLLMLTWSRFCLIKISRQHFVQYFINKSRFT